MISKKLFFSFLTLSIISTSIVHASNIKDTIKTGSALTAGLAAGAAVGKYMPGPLPAKIVAGIATSAVVTPWLTLFVTDDERYTARPKTWKEEVKRDSVGAIILGHPIAVPALGVSAAIGLGSTFSSLPAQVLTGAAVATGLTAAGFAVWYRLLAAAATPFRG